MASSSWSSSWRKRQLDKLATLVECSRVSSRQAGLLTAWVADMIRESCGGVDTVPGAVAAATQTAVQRRVIEVAMKRGTEANEV
ncbi:hypothetical protein HPB50_000916 [Hyalomma asiaticum]|uniref:Uncharacterized protein n=1 Tax=Hyalomma asiaticum TaxID=266040 RepID=A0ACB7SAF4_HYAAI|nr:hypothetical protein HPB50_000916 [Hyalomma asiaticum]